MGIPAYSVLSPSKPGNYRLVFLDEKGHQLAEKPYVVNPALRTLPNPPPSDLSGVSIQPVGAAETPGRVRVAMENTSPYYLQSHTNHWAVPPSVRTLPSYGEIAVGSLFLRLKPDPEDPSEAAAFPLPFDLPPGGRVEIDLSADRFTVSPTDVIARLAPHIRSIEDPGLPARRSDPMIAGRPVAEGRRTR
jgi:hypothetical protein